MFHKSILPRRVFPFFQNKVASAVFSLYPILYFIIAHFFPTVDSFVRFFIHAPIFFLFRGCSLVFCP